MAIAKYSKEYKVNMGNYEHLVFGLDILLNNETDPENEGLTNAELIRKVRIMVEEALVEDIQAAASDTEKEDSFIHLHPANQPAK